MLKTKTFKGANVFMSRNLVPPEIFDALIDALKHNGADVFLCCDPSRSGPNDYHIISSIDHEKFEDLKAKGCNLLGPQCVLSCAKEHRFFPKQEFTCCLAMDGVKVLASGFEMDEKVKLGKLVTAMGGVLHTKASLDVSFVIVKNVLAAKYKWALTVLKKPIVTVNWLYQCWNEHRVVPQDSYRVLPFSGLTICVTRIPADARKEIEMLISQNGGKYSAELTKKCTHLISDISSCLRFTCNLCKRRSSKKHILVIAPEGDKYKVARRWGHIHIVTRKWFDQSIARRACLNEESYPVQGGSVSSNKVINNCLKAQNSQEKDIGEMQSAACSSVADSDLPVCCNKFVDRDKKATDSQNFSSSFSNAPVYVTKADSEAHIVQPNNEVNLDSTVASDSQSDDNDLYLSECRILLVGFEASQMRRLVNMVRRGGGSRYMSFNDKLTHIVIGIPSEMEKKDVRSLAAMGVIHVVRTSWLEDCDREKKEVPILRRHVASDLLLPKGALTGLMGLNQGKNSTIHQSMLADQVVGSKDSVIGTPSSLDSNIEGKPEIGVNRQISSKAVGRSTVQSQLPIVNNKVKDQEKMQHDSSVQNGSSSTAFRGKRFRFSNSFPEDRRAEVAQWVYQGRGEVVDDHFEQNVHFTIACHGMKPSSADVLWSTSVSSHWIRSCLEDGSLLDINSHILYSPLPCHIPLPGFENFRFCVSQYEDKDRVLLRNLCFVLGAKFVEKLNKKVTHLLCKFTSGPKYEAACKWGIHSITSEWMFECVKQNRIVALDPFLPKEVTAQDQEAGFCTVSQFPTQAVRMIGADSPSQFHSQSENLKNTPVYKVHRESEKFRDETKISSKCSKKARIFEDHGLNSGYPMCDMHPTEDNILKDTGETSEAFPDVAAAIEDLLEQTSKIHSQKSPSRTECDRSLFSSEFSILGEDHSNAHSVTGLSKHWLNRRGRKDDECNVSGDGNGDVFYGFSETQADSQVVGYEEDLSGRQMLIEKIRTRNSLT